MEEILTKLLVADNEVLQQGTRELREAFKKPGVILSLCTVVVTSSNSQIRQYAALLLRKRLTKSKHWFKLSEDERTLVKQGILPALVNEPLKPVKTGIAQFVGTIMKHELPNNTWPQLLEFVQQLNTSSNIEENELGMFILDVLTEFAPRLFLKESAALCHLLRNVLKNAGQQDLTSPIVYHGICVLTNMTAVAEQDEALISLFHEVLPLWLQVIEAYASKDETKALKIMEYLDGLLDCVTEVIVPHIKMIIPACVAIAKENALGDDLRVKALSFVSEIVSRKKKAVIRHNLVKPILDALFQLMSTPSEDDEEVCFDDEDNEGPGTAATQTLDVLALNLPPEKIMPYVLEFVEHGLSSNNIYTKKATYMAMAVLVEGCSDYIRERYLKQFLNCVCKGITDQACVVRNAALYALGQFSEHLQPEISEYAEELLPVLFQFLQQLCSGIQQKGEGFKDPPGVDRMFYALEVFCENLGDGLVPHLPILMESLFTAMNPQISVHIQELAISAVGASANAVKEEMVPYFQKIVDSLKIYLVEEQPPEKLCLQVQAVDTLGVLARVVGEETFRPLAEESLKLGMTLLKTVEDPDLRKSVYGLLASISTVLKTEISVVLPAVVESMLNSLKSQEGILTEFKEDDQNSAFPVYEDISDADEEDIENESERSEDDDDFACFNVENAYMEEKEQACMALGELARQAGLEFMPYMDQCFEEVLKMASFPHPDVRKAAVAALAQFCISLTSIKNEQGEQALLKALSVLVPKCSEIIHTDDDRDVVMSALDSLGELLSELKSIVLVGEGHRDAIINCIRDVMTHKTECQDDEDPTSNEESEDDEEAEQDELLVKYAGDVVPHLGKAMSQEDFSQYFKAVLPMFLSKMKKRSTVSQRAFNIGIIAECMEPLGSYSAQYINDLLPLIIQMTNDEHEEVRNNAIFGLGEFIMYAKEALYPHYSHILQVLSLAVSKEKEPGPLDNICGALSRMILTNMNGVPIEDVFPVFLKHLPLRRDFEENRMVFRCLNALYQVGHKAILSQVSSVLKLSMVVLYKGQYPDKETLECVASLLTSIKRDFPNDFVSATSELTPKQLEILNKRLSCSNKG